MNDRGLLSIGIIGVVIAAIYCSMPLGVILLEAAGVSAWLLWFDFAVLPCSSLVLGLIAFVLVLRQKAS